MKVNTRPLEISFLLSRGLYQIVLNAAKTFQNKHHIK